MSERDALLRNVMKYFFAVTDTALFLDTHPGEKAALSAMKKYNEQLSAAKAAYEEKYGMLELTSDSGSERWKWIDDPWPWQIAEE